MDRTKEWIDVQYFNDLQSLIRAALAAGPFPVVMMQDETMEYVCAHCGSDGINDPASIYHDNDCAGVRLAEALAALGEAT